MGINETIRKEVRAGANLLDTGGPSGWFKMVDMDRFRMSNPACCILGQVFGYEGERTPYGNGLVTLDIMGIASNYGFAYSTYRDENMPTDELESMYYDAWREEVSLRQMTSAITLDSRELVTA